MRENRARLQLLALLGLMLLASGCTSQPANWLPEQVSAPAIPELPSEARQLETPSTAPRAKRMTHLRGDEGCSVYLTDNDL